MSQNEDAIDALANRQLAGEITAGIDGGYNQMVELLDALDAASKYIVCLRQMVYARDPDVLQRAREASDMLGSKWHVHLTDFEQLPERYSGGSHDQNEQ